MALEFVQETDSPDKAWRPLQQHYRASDLDGKDRLMREFNAQKLKQGERPKNLFLKVQRAARELRRLGKAVDQDDKNLAIESGLSPEHEVERRMLQEGDKELTRARIERVITNHYGRLQENKSEAGAMALAVMAQSAAEIC